MSGRHRRTAVSPARRALLGTVPLVGGVGVVAALMLASQPGQAPAATTTATTTTLPGAATAPGATSSEVLPGRGEAAMDAVAGARDAILAHQNAGARSAVRVSTVADELRAEAEQRAARARAQGDAALAAYHRDEAAHQQRAAATSRPVVPAPHTTPEDPIRSTDPDDSTDGTDGTDSTDSPDGEAPDTGHELPDPGPHCDVEDVIRVGPLTVTGDDCGTDPWKTEQVRDAAARGHD